ncbi:MAG: hydrolase-type esterase, partial [Paenibacillus sp.]|nr:hydrolase-type esterase [Paenibacillus sp.]
VAAFADAGDQHIVFFDGSTLLGEDYEECTVDGGHPTDLGFVRMAEGLAPTFRQLLK